MKVDFEDRKYWKTQKCNNLIKPADLLAKSTSDVLCNFVFIFHWDDGVISMNFYPIWPVINAQSNLTGRIGSKSIAIDASWIHWDDTQFNQGGIQHLLFVPFFSCFWGRSNSTGHEILVKLGWKSLRLHSMATWSNLVVKISMDLLPIRPVEFNRLAEFDRAWNTG